MAVEEKYAFFIDIIEQFEDEFYPDISEAVVPFTNFGNTEEKKYIYEGHEKIPFKERDPTYQKIFIHEFFTR
ncbi:MAG: hypothetical protein ACW98X_20965 [Promethearchaeota archaeon]|jgi:hypothetical protein